MLDLTYEIKPSSYSYLILLIIFISSLAVIMMSDLPFFLILIFFIFLLISFWPLSRQFLEKIDIKRLNANEWHIKNQNIDAISHLLGDSIVTPYFMLLRFQCRNQIKSYIVLRASMPNKDFKKLLMLLNN